MRKILVLAVIAAQLALLAYMAGEREWLLRTGQIVSLRTAPIDPNDPMRGDYVRLSYELASVPKSLCRDGVVRWFDEKQPFAYTHARDRLVYASVKLDATGIAELVALSDLRPPAGLFLRGRVNGIYMNSVDVRFGLEALFMQQGRARAFENTIRTDKAGVPLIMEVAVNSRGLSTIKGYRWEPLGITLTLDRASAQSQTPDTPRIPRSGLRGVTVELKNHSDAPVAIIDHGATHCFRLIANRNQWQPESRAEWQWIHAADAPAKPAPGDLIRLQPGESHRVHLDFTAEEWLVQKAGSSPTEPTSLAALGEDWNASFRIEYAPPSADACADLPDATLIRHGRLRSRMFNAAGGGD